MCYKQALKLLIDEFAPDDIIESYKLPDFYEFIIAISKDSYKIRIYKNGTIVEK